MKNPGVIKHDNTVIIGQGLGVIAAGTLLIVLYQTEKKERKTTSNGTYPKVAVKCVMKLCVSNKHLCVKSVLRFEIATCV